ncbi:Small-conductance mechanosensitive channel [Sinobacterium norvegicum]|uniref:Small-conductance mechanosensitive channel n=1 Tax=Sinobacterium norvegicum TaxID=1641715 RepID=A0ABN8EMX8_9GAMM|nr:mechanosensitive ion channel domain-containing protein [Sinobacterium norvegicum]CAH0992742.1 Small-conductance mechanosensitive channel [Sinobacterium norvegicum]
MENFDMSGYEDQAINIAIQLGSAILIYLVGMMVARMVTGFVNRAMEKKGIEKTVSAFVGNIIHGLVVGLVLVIVLSQLGVQTASLVAVLGAAGLAVGLALQGSLSNFASGVLLVMFRPLKVGDFVDAGGAAGTVESVTMFSTVIVTPDNKQVTVPNTSVLSGPIVNYSAKPIRRVDLLVGVAYDADLAQVKKILADIVASDDNVLEGEEVTIAVKELADSSVNFVMRSWVKKENYWPSYFDQTEKVKLALDAAGISIPFPQVDVHFEKSA